MERKTILRAWLTEYSVVIKTVDVNGAQSPRDFFILKSNLDALETNGKVLCKDLLCFAQLSLDKKHDRLSIEFYWLLGHFGKGIDGFKQRLTIRWSRFKAFLSQKQDTEFCAYDIGDYMGRPKFTFCDSSTLKRILANSTVRRKCIQFLNEGFNWLDSDEIRFYDYHDSYTLFFREYQDGKETGVCGWLVLLNADDPYHMCYCMYVC